MKKNLTLLLALAMIVSCVLGIMPAADSIEGGGADVESYKPEIAYANVNYIDDVVLMFAVPAPAEGAIAEGSSVKLVVWEAASRIYSYTDTVATGDTPAAATAIEAEEAKITIGGVEHLVYKYDKLEAQKMTDTVYARAVVVDKDDKAMAYSDVLDYSVVEYVETAKGSFADGTPIVSEDTVELLDTLLTFGAAVQKIANDGEGHIPNGYLADDELHKIWVTPVIAGTKLVKVFGGFFKYEEGGYATVCEPFFDGYEPAVYKDAQGNVLADANPQSYEEALGFQIDAVDSDIEITIEYSYILHRQINSADYGTDFYMSNVEQIVYGQVAKDNGAGSFSGWSAYMRKVSGDSTGGATINLGGQNGLSGSWFNSVKMVEDPSNPGNYLFQFTSSNGMYFSINSYISSSGKTFYGYGDTIEKAVTWEIELGKTNPDDVVTINGVYLRDRSTWGGWSKDYAYDGDAPTENADLKKYGSSNLFSYIFRVIENEVILPGNKEVICTLPDTGLVKVAITICGNNELKAYYSNANGDMVLAGTWDAEEAMIMSNSYKDKHAQYLANLKDDNLDNNDDLLPYKDVATFVEMSTLETSMYLGPQGANSTDYHSSTLNTRWPAEFATATVEIDGSAVPVLNADGTYNAIAMRAYMEKNYGFLMRTFTVYIGDVYGVNIEDRYEVDNTLKSFSGEDLGEGFAFSNLTDKIGVYDGNPAVISAIGATHGRDGDTALNGYRFEKIFRRAWFDGNIGGAKFFQGFKTVADPSNPNNLVLQITSANANTLDLETIKPEELAKVGWGADGAITLELEIGKSNPDTSVNTRVFQIHRRTDENPGAAFTKNSQFDLFKVTNDEIIFYGGTDTVIGTVPNTGFVKIAFVINGNGVIKAYCSNADGAMVYAGEKDFSQLAMFASEDFASWMNHVITPRWYVGSNLGDAATIQAATVEIDGAQVPVYADGAYNEAALQLYMEQNHSFLLDNYKIVAGAIYE